MEIVLFKTIILVIAFIVLFIIIEPIFLQKKKQKESFYDFLNSDDIGSWNAEFCHLRDNIKEIKRPLQWHYDDSENCFWASLMHNTDTLRIYCSVIKYVEENNKKIFVPDFEIFYSQAVSEEENKILNEKFNKWLKEMDIYFDKYENYKTKKEIEKRNKRINLLK